MNVISHNYIFWRGPEFKMSFGTNILESKYRDIFHIFSFNPVLILCGISFLK